METCVCCGKEQAEYRFRTLKVQTLSIRDLGGEKRVQALGTFQDWNICRDCAGAKLAELRRPGKKLIRAALPFAGALGLGVILTVRYWVANGVLRLLGLAGLFCGIAGLISTVSSTVKCKRASEGLSEPEALDQAAWACLLETLPGKDGDNDLTYIPVNSRTLAMKNGDLMIEYKLLPEIAKKAYSLLHEPAETA